MFSPFTRDFLKPQLFQRMDSLMKAIPPAIEDPCDGDYSKFDIFPYKLQCLKNKEIGTFQLFLNANHFQPHHISIKIEGGFIVIHAKRDVKPDKQGYTCREFTRRCKIPENIDPVNFSSTFNKNGLLVVKANTKPADSSSIGEVTIPIEIHDLHHAVGLHVESEGILEESVIQIPVSNRVP